MRLTILSSGSGGNSLCVQTASTAVYIDAGLRKGRLRERWQRVPAEPAPAGRPAAARPRPSAAFLTHEHGDHVAGADDLAAGGLLLYATAPTASALGLSARGRLAVRELAAAEPVVHGDLRVLPVSLPHDAAAPVAYVISDGTLRLGVITDCGQPSAALAGAFADCDALVLETNHDRRMLFAGPYPERLKRRIVSGHGHLSNEQAGELLAGILAASQVEPAVVICAHLSKVNNRPELAARAVRTVLAGRPTAVVVAEQDHPLLPRQLVAGRRIPRAEQLTLAL